MVSLLSNTNDKNQEQYINWKKWLENNYRLVTSQLSNSHVNNQKNQLKCNIL